MVPDNVNSEPVFEDWGIQYNNKNVLVFGGLQHAPAQSGAFFLLTVDCKCSVSLQNIFAASRTAIHSILSTYLPDVRIC